MVCDSLCYLHDVDQPDGPEHDENVLSQTGVVPFHQGRKEENVKGS